MVKMDEGHVLDQVSLSGTLLLPLQRRRATSNGSSEIRNHAVSWLRRLWAIFQMYLEPTCREKETAHVFIFDSVSMTTAYLGQRCEAPEGHHGTQHPAAMWLDSRARGRLSR
jgi:hypothetical protein